MDYSNLLRRAQSRGLTPRALAAVAGLTENSLSLRLNGRVPFTSPEIRRLVAWLEIPPEEIGVYFFAAKV